jgi:hypothetical protein
MWRADNRNLEPGTRNPEPEPGTLNLNPEPGTLNRERTQHLEP